MATHSDEIAFVLEDTFHIAGLGTILAPTLAADRFPHGTSMRLHADCPDGTQRTARGHFWITHAQVRGGPGRWDGVIVLDADADAFPMGSTVTATPMGGPSSDDGG